MKEPFRYGKKIREKRRKRFLYIVRSSRSQMIGLLIYCSLLLWKSRNTDSPCCFSFLNTAVFFQTCAFNCKQFPPNDWCNTIWKIFCQAISTFPHQSPCLVISQHCCCSCIAFPLTKSFVRPLVPFTNKNLNGLFGWARRIKHCMVLIAVHVSWLTNYLRCDLIDGLRSIPSCSHWAKRDVKQGNASQAIN